MSNRTLRLIVWLPIVAFVLWFWIVAFPWLISSSLAKPSVCDGYPGECAAAVEM